MISLRIKRAMRGALRSWTTHAGVYIAVIGYLLPALALLLGAALGNAWGGDPGTALGAIAAFALTLLMLRLAAGRLPWLLPRPQIARAPAPEFSQPRLAPTSRRLP